MAFSFDGSTHLTTPTLNHGIGTGDFSVSVWGYTTSISSTERVLWESSGTGFSLHSTGPASVNVTVGVTNVSYHQMGAAITANAWHHLCLVRTGSTVRVWVNGTIAPVSLTSSANFANSAQIIGRSEYFGKSALNGSRVAELAIWSAALSAGEIVGLSKRVAPPDVRTNGLWLYMPMRRERVDRWSFGGSATVTGTESYATHPPMVETLLGSTGDVAAGGGGGGGSGPVLQRLGLGLGVGV